jgi:hypothetical protein
MGDNMGDQIIKINPANNFMQRTQKLALLSR